MKKKRVALSAKELLKSDGQGSFRKSRLANGATLVSEVHPYSQAFSVGFWFTKGTRHEPKSLMGVSHFLEHLTFKNTKNRDHYDIAYDIESVGGEINAFTSKENTCIHALVLNRDWRIAMDVLSDVAFQMKPKPKDFALEKKVVLQEIDLALEQYEDAIYDFFFAAALPGSPLAWPILGEQKTIENLKLREVVDHYYRSFNPANLIVSVTGKFEHDEVLANLNKWLDKRCGRVSKPTVELPQRNRRVQHKWHSGVHFQKASSEQHHVLMGIPAPSFQSEKRFEAVILNALLGGGMTSVLFQKIREKAGLSYSVHSQLATFEDFGFLSVYAGTQKKSVQKVVDLVQKELAILAKKGINRAALELYREQIIGGLLLGAEDVENRMHSLAINEMIFGEYRPVSRVIEEVRQVSLESMNEFVREHLKNPPWAVVALGDENPF